MSLGFLGKCKLVSVEGDRVWYCYGGENWNIPEKSHMNEEYDGHIEFDSSLFDHLFAENMFDIIYNNINTDNIIIIPSQNDFFRGDTHVYYIAHHLIMHIFDYYKKYKKYPEVEAFIQ